MNATDIVAYTFNADVYCPDCIPQLVTHRMVRWPEVNGNTEMYLRLVAKFAGANRMDEYSFDSGDFPKVVFSSQVDGTEYCGSCGRKIGE